MSFEDISSEDKEEVAILFHLGDKVQWEGKKEKKKRKKIGYYNKNLKKDSIKTSNPNTSGRWNNF